MLPVFRAVLKFLLAKIMTKQCEGVQLKQTIFVLEILTTEQWHNKTVSGA